MQELKENNEKLKRKNELLMNALHIDSSNPSVYGSAKNKKSQPYID